MYFARSQFQKKNFDPRTSSNIDLRTSFLSFLQEEILAQEKARLEALRLREQDRAKRFMNAKCRSIGVDKIGIDKQVEEKRLFEIAQKEEKLAEGESIVM